MITRWDFWHFYNDLASPGIPCHYIILIDLLPPNQPVQGSIIILQSWVWHWTTATLGSSVDSDTNIHLLLLLLLWAGVQPLRAEWLHTHWGLWSQSGLLPAIAGKSQTQVWRKKTNVFQKCVCSLGYIEISADGGGGGQCKSLLDFTCSDTRDVAQVSPSLLLTKSARQRKPFLFLRKSLVAPGGILEF